MESLVEVMESLCGWPRMEGCIPPNLTSEILRLEQYYCTVKSWQPYFRMCPDFVKDYFPIHTELNTPESMHIYTSPYSGEKYCTS